MAFRNAALAPARSVFRRAPPRLNHALAFVGALATVSSHNETSEFHTAPRANVSPPKMHNMDDATQVRRGICSRIAPRKTAKASIGIYRRCSNATSRLGTILELGASSIKNASGATPNSIHG